MAQADDDSELDFENTEQLLHDERLVVKLPPYSDAGPDVQPASYHALNYAYTELKKRYNDLHGKYKSMQRNSRSGSSSLNRAGGLEEEAWRQRSESPNFMCLHQGPSSESSNNVSPRRSPTTSPTHKQEDEEYRAYIPNGGERMNARDFDSVDTGDKADYKEHHILQKFRTNGLLKKIGDLEQQNSELVRHNTQLKQTHAQQVPIFNSHFSQGNQHVLELEAENENLRKKVLNNL